MKEMLKFFAMRADAGDWEYETDPVDHVRFAKKLLFEDVQSGVHIRYCVYPAGYCKSAHHHTFGQGLYVLKGDMLANGVLYHPGDYVWFPAGSVGTHGATDAEECAFLVFSEGYGQLIYD